MLELFDRVQLLIDLPGHNLSAGSIGVVVMIFEEPQASVEVEFCDSFGRTVAEIAIKPGDLHKVDS